MRSDAINVDKFIRDWLADPKKARVYGNYYSKVFNDKSFLLQFSSEYDGFEVRLIAVNFLKDNKILYNTQINTVIPKTTRDILPNYSNAFAFDLYSLEKVYQEDVLDLEFIEAKQINNPLSQVLVKCGSKNYVQDMPAEAFSPMKVAVYRASGDLTKWPNARSSQEIFETSASSLDEVRQMSYKGMKPSDIIFDKYIFLEATSETGSTVVPDFVLKGCKYCPDPTTVFGPNAPLNAILSSTSHEEFKKELWEYLYNKHLYCLFKSAGKNLSRNGNSFDADRHIVIKGANAQGDVFCEAWGADFKIVPKEGAVKCFCPPSILDGKLGGIKYVSEQARIIKSPYHENFYIGLD